MGYTPLYDTLLSGTLYGRWPHTGVWACLLSRASREGVIDETPQCLAAAIGVPVETLMECISDFMEPDPNSRSSTHEGRRLVPIDAARSWGWKVVNHGKYREKARKQAYDADRTESGRDAERKRELRAEENASRDVPTRPAMSRDVPLSEAEATPESERARRPRGARRCPTDAEIDLPWALAELPDLDAEAEAAKFRDYEFAKPRTDWPATWRNWIRTCKSSGKYARRTGSAGKPMFLPNGKPNPEAWL